MLGSSSNVPTKTEKNPDNQASSSNSKSTSSNIACGALKIDFKIDDAGIPRIIDIGDGLAAGLEGFEKENIEVKLLHDMHLATGAKICPIFGELDPCTLDASIFEVPMHLRRMNDQDSYLDCNDLKNVPDRLLPICTAKRLSAYFGYYWSKQGQNVVSTPLSLISMEMHKILLYMLTDKLMSPDLAPVLRKPILYWENDTSPDTMVLPDLDIYGNGIFVKIADRSTGGANEVYYVKDKTELIECLKKLNADYQSNKEKHIFVIEPAYVTIKKYQDKDYNATGRAFVTFIYNQNTDSLDMKIAEARWFLPKMPLNKEKTRAQMLANAKNSLSTLSLNSDELSQLKEGILKYYASILKACFHHNDLFAYCADHPKMTAFKSCIRPSSAYLMLLNAFETQSKPNEGERKPIKAILFGIVYGHVRRDVIMKDSGLSFFLTEAAKLNQHQTVGVIMEHICYLSFITNYIKEIKKLSNSTKQQLNDIPQLIQQEEHIKKLLTLSMGKYLTIAGTIAGVKFDLKDFNKALRQAAYYGQPEAAKLLAYTRLANSDVSSPTNLTALDYARKGKNEGKLNCEKCITLLENVSSRANAVFSNSSSTQIVQSITPAYTRIAVTRIAVKPVDWPIAMNLESLMFK